MHLLVLSVKEINTAEHKKYHGLTAKLVMQVAILMSKFAPSTHVAAPQGPASVLSWPDSDLTKMGDLHEGFASVQRRLDSIVQALVANGIDI